MKVTLKQADLHVAPGGTTDIDVVVENTGRSTITPVLDVVGLDGCIPTGITSLESLAPGATARTTLTLSLPPEAAPGNRRVAVIAKDSAGSGQAAAHLVLHTGSAAQVSMHMSPRESRARLGAKFRVNLHNHGVEPIELDLSGSGEGLKIRLKPSHLMLPIGASVRLRGRVVATRPSFRNRRRPFLITAQGTTTPSNVSGSFQQLTLVPRAFMRLAIMAIVLSMVASIAYVGERRLSSSSKGKTTLAGVGKSSTTVAKTASKPGVTGASTDPVASPDGAAAAAPVAGGKAAGSAPADAPVAGGAAKAVATNPEVAKPAAAVVSGTISGPGDMSGIPVVLQQVLLGDLGTKSSGKLPAQSVGKPLAAEVLSEQRTVTDVGGRFRFAGNLAVPGIYRITAIRAGYEQANVIASLTADAPASEVALSLVPASGRLSGKVVDAAGLPIGDATVTVKDGLVTYTARTASGGDNAGGWSIEGVHTPTSYLVSAVAPGFATGSTLVEMSGGQVRSDANLTLVRGLGSLHGVVSSRGVGVGGITMEIRAVEGDTTRTTTTLTDARLVGSFTVPALPLGRYSITLSGEGWLTQTRQVLLDSGDLLVDISDLRRATAVIQGRIFQMADPGCAYPAPGATGANATAQPCGNVGVTVESDLGVWKTTSASGTGAFFVSGVPAGTFTIRLERYGYTTAVLSATVGAGDIATLGPVGAKGVDPIVLVLNPNGAGTNSSLRVVLRDDHDPLVELNLACLHPSVTVTESTGITSAVLLSGSGNESACIGGTSVVLANQLPGSTVRPAFDICPIDAPIPGFGARACLAPGGGLRVEGLAPGAKTVKISADGFDQSEVIAQVPASSIAELGVVRLLPLASLSGQVSGPNDSPVFGGRVFITPSDVGVKIPTPSTVTEGGWYLCSADVDHTGTPLNGLCVDTGQGGEYKFGRSLRSGRYRVVAPVGDVTASPSVSTPPAISLDHEVLSRNISLLAGQADSLDVHLHRYGAIIGVIQSPDSTGTNYTIVPDVEITVTPSAGIANTARITVGSGTTGSLTAGRYRIDRLRRLDETRRESYSVTFHKVGYRDEVVVFPGGVTFNEEILRNVILLPAPVLIKGTIVWRPDPAVPATVVPIAGAQVQVDGVLSYTVVDTPPFVIPVRGGYKTTSLANGTFQDTAATPVQFSAGRSIITVSAAGFTSRTVDLSLAEAASATIVLEASAHGLTGSATLFPAVVVPGEPTTASSIWAGLLVSLRPPAGGSPTTVGLSATGEFVFATVRPDARPYSLTISGPGVQTTVTPVTVSPAADTVVPPITINRRGRIVASVKTGNGTPVGGATIELMDGATVSQTAVSCVDPSQPGGIIGCAAGTVTFDDLNLRTYTLAASKVGWRSATSGSIDLSTQALQIIPALSLLKFGDASGIVIGKLSDTATSTAPLPGARISAVPASGGASVSVYAGADGSFTLVGDLPAGTYNITVSATGYADLVLTGKTIANERTTALGDLTLVALAATLRGTVTLTGPTVGVTATVKVVEANVTVTVASDGSYKFLNLPPRNYTVEFTADDNRGTVTRFIALRAADSQNLDVTLLGPIGALFGTVDGKDSTADFVADPLIATINVKKSDGSVVGTATSSSGGNYSIENLAIGLYTVEFSATGYDTVTRPLQVAAKSTQFLTATLIAVPRTVRPTVESTLGGALEMVTITATKGAKTVTVVTASDGIASFGLLSPGSWTITISNASTAKRGGVVDPHANTAQANLVVGKVPSAPPTPTYVLNRYEGITMVATGKDDASDTAAPLVGATVTATPTSGPAVTLPVTSTAGTYGVRAPLSPGAWTVSVSAPGYVTQSKAVTVTADNVVSDVVELLASTRNVTVAAQSSSGSTTLAGVKVVATRVGGTPSDPLPTLADGTVIFANLAPGTYTFASTNGAALTNPHGDVSLTAVVVPRSPTATPTPTLKLDRDESLTVILLGRDTSTSAATALRGATVTATLGTTTVTLVESTSTLGSYSVSQALAAGTWTLTATKTGYETLAVAPTLSVAADEQATKAVTLTASARTVAVSVTSSATGGLMGVVVTATLDASPSTSVGGSTNVNGLVNLTLSPGAWTLKTSNAIIATKAAVLTPHEDASSSLVVDVGVATDVLSKSIQLTAATVAVDGIVESSFVGGTTVALSGAALSVTRTGGLTAYPSTSGTAGAFSLSLPPSKTWSVDTSAAGHTTSTTSLVTGATATTSAGTISLTRLPLTIAGTVRRESALTAVEGVTVNVRSMLSDTIVNTANTDSSGAYSIAGLDPNSAWRVTFVTMSATDAAVKRQPVTRIVAASTGGTTVTLDHLVAQFAGSMTINVVGNLAGQTGVTISIPTAQVVVTDVPSGASVKPLIDPVSVAATGGTATVSGLPVGSTYKVSVTAPNFGTASGTAVAVEEAGVAITDGGTKTVTINLYPLARTVKVHVVDAGGNDVDAATLTPSGGGGSLTAQTTAGGGLATFTSVPVAPSGVGSPWQLAVSGVGLVSGKVDVAVPVGVAATDISVTIKLEQLEVTVQGQPAGSPAPALVDLASADVTATQGTTTVTLAKVSAGLYRMKGVLSGTWSVKADGAIDGYATQTDAVVAITADAVTAKSFALAAVPRLSNFVVKGRGAGTPLLAGVTVVATLTGTAPAPAVTSAATDASGATSLDLSAGTWTITTTGAASATVGSPGVVDQHVNEAGQPVTVAATGVIPTTTLKLARVSESITINLLGKLNSAATASALSGATVTGANGTATATFTEAAGVYSSVEPQLAAGTWTLTITPPAGYDAPGTVTVTVVANGAVAAPATTLIASKRDVAVKVVDATSNGLSGITVTATLTGETDVAKTTIDSTGTVMLALRPGSWTLTTTGATVPLSDGSLPAASVPVSPAATTTYTITLT